MKKDNYRVFARKYRPQLFKEVIGQTHIIQTLKNSLKYNRIAHAYIFSGPRGIGKTTIARIFSKALNCLNLQEDIEPCNKCANCLAIMEGSSIDVMEIDGASNRGIEEVRALRENVKFAPTNSRYKIYIIDEVHMVTSAAFNALLKTLEEPPEYIIFLFATTEIHKLPETILSRCQKFYLNRLSEEKIIEALNRIIKEENLKVDEKVLAYIVNKADGALRDAESLLDQIVSFAGKEVKYDEVIKVLGILEIDLFFNFINAIINNDYKKIFELVHNILIQGNDFSKFLEDLLEQFHLILLAKTIGKDLSERRKDLSKEYIEKYLYYAEKFTIFQLRNIVNELLNSINLAKYTSQIRILVEVTLFKIIEIKNSIDISNILNRLNEFENYLKNNKILINKATEMKLTSDKIETEQKRIISETNIKKDNEQIIKEAFEILKDELILINDIKEIEIEKIEKNVIYLNICKINELKKKRINQAKKRLEEAFSKVLNKDISLEIIDKKEDNEDIFEKMMNKNKENKIPIEVRENKIVKTILEKVGGEIIKVE